MDSQSKISLPVEQVERIVTAHFGEQVNLVAFEELKEGFFNAAGLLELSDGRKMVIKAAPPVQLRVMRYEHNLMKAEVESMRLVRQQTSVPVPEILVYDTSKTLLPSDFFIMSFVPGVPFHKLRKTTRPEDQFQVEIQIGGLFRQISEISGSTFGLWSAPEAPGVIWRDCFDRLLRSVLADRQDLQVDLGKPYEEIYQLFCRHYDVLDEITTPRLVHWDLWDGNIFVDPETLQVTGIIDFERVLWGDPLTESFFLCFNPNSGYLTGYGENLLASDRQKRRRMLYDTYLYLILIIECYFRHYANNDQETWARGQIQEMFKLME